MIHCVNFTGMYCILLFIYIQFVRFGRFHSYLGDALADGWLVSMGGFGNGGGDCGLRHMSILSNNVSDGSGWTIC